MLPQITVEGTVVFDPELKYAATGTPVVRMRVVANSRKPDPDNPGQWVNDKTLWLDVTAFKSLAENIAESVVKGDKVIVMGRLQTDEWTNDQGEKQSRMVCLADSVGPALNFRAIPHTAGKVERVTSGANDPFASSPTATDSEPPF